MKDDQRNYIIVGGFVVTVLIGFVLWLAILSGSTRSTDDYYIVYRNVANLTKGTEIFFEGYPMGSIEDITPVEIDGAAKFRVDVSVFEGWVIPEDSVAKIDDSGLIKPAVIQIHGGTSPTRVQPGTQIPSQDVINIFAMVGDLAENSVRPLVDSLTEAIPGILEEVTTFTRELNVALERMKEVLKPGNTDRIEEILINLAATSDNVSAATAGLQNTQDQLDHILGKVNQLLDEEEGPVGQAVADLQHSMASVARHIDGINANLEAATRNMNEFSRQIREDPGVLIRGRNVGDDAGAN